MFENTKQNVEKRLEFVNNELYRLDMVQKDCTYMIRYLEEYNFLMKQKNHTKLSASLTLILTFLLSINAIQKANKNKLSIVMTSIPLASFLFFTKKTFSLQKQIHHQYCSFHPLSQQKIENTIQMLQEKNQKYSDLYHQKEQEYQFLSNILDNIIQDNKLLEQLDYKYANLLQEYFERLDRVPNDSHIQKIKS